jgi:hypothetical protein
LPFLITRIHPRESGPPFTFGEMIFGDRGAS